MVNSSDWIIIGVEGTGAVLTVAALLVYYLVKTPSNFWAGFIKYVLPTGIGLMIVGFLLMLFLGYKIPTTPKK